MSDYNVSFGVGMKVDHAGFNEAKKAFQDLYKAADPNNTNRGYPLTQELWKAADAAKTLETAMERAYNPNLKSFNIRTLNAELEKSGTSLTQIQQTFTQAGSLGEKALLNMSKAVITSNDQIKMSNTLIEKMGTTLANSFKWTVASSFWNNIIGSVQTCINYVEDLDTSLNRIQIVTGKSADQMAQFAEQANNAARNLGTTTTAYSDAALTFYQQGLSDTEANARAELSMKVSNVTGLSAEDSAEYVTSVLNGYKVGSEEAEAAMDKLAAIGAHTASSLGELSEAMSKTASAASTMGVTEDQLAAQLATIISVTRADPSSVGTALKTVYSRITDISTGADGAEVSLGTYSDKLAALGINVLDMNGRLRDMGSVMEEIGEKWSTYNKEQQVSIAQTMGGARQYSQLISLFDNWGMYVDALGYSYDSLGTLQQQEDVYLESNVAHIRHNTAAWQDFYDSILDEKAINAVYDGLSGIGSALANITDGLGGGIPAMMAFGAALSGVFNKQLSVGIGNFAAQLKENLNSKDVNIQNTIDAYTANLAAEGQSSTAINAMAEVRKQSLSVGEQYFTSEQKTQVMENISAIGDLVAEQENLKASAVATKEEFIQYCSQLGITQEELKKIQESEDGLGAATELLRDKISNIKNIQPFDELIISYSEIKDESGKVQAQVENLMAAFQRSGGSADGIKNLSDGLERIKSNFEQDSAAAKEFERICQQIMQAALGLATTDFIPDGELEEDRTRLAQIDEQLKNIEDSNNRIFNSANVGYAKMTSGIIDSVSAVGSLGMGLSSVHSMFKAFTSDSISGTEKLLTLMTSLGFAVPSLAAGLTKVGQQSGIIDAFKAARNVNNVKQEAVSTKMDLISKKAKYGDAKKAAADATKYKEEAEAEAKAKTEAYQKAQREADRKNDDYKTKQSEVERNKQIKQEAEDAQKEVEAKAKAKEEASKRVEALEKPKNLQNRYEEEAKEAARLKAEAEEKAQAAIVAKESGVTYSEKSLRNANQAADAAAERAVQTQRELSEAQAESAKISMTLAEAKEAEAVATQELEMAETAHVQASGQAAIAEMEEASAVEMATQAEEAAQVAKEQAKTTKEEMTVATEAAATAEAEETIATENLTVAEGEHAAASEVAAAAEAKLASEGTILTAVQTKLTAAFKANPFFFIITGIMAAVAAYNFLKDVIVTDTEEVTEAFDGLEETTETLERLKEQQEELKLSILDAKNANDGSRLAILEAESAELQRQIEFNETLARQEAEKAAKSFEDAYQSGGFNNGGGGEFLGLYNDIGGEENPESLVNQIKQYQVLGSQNEKDAEWAQKNIAELYSRNEKKIEELGTSLKEANSGEGIYTRATEVLDNKESATEQQIADAEEVVEKYNAALELYTSLYKQIHGETDAGKTAFDEAKEAAEEAQTAVENYGSGLRAISKIDKNGVFDVSTKKKSEEWEALEEAITQAGYSVNDFFAYTDEGWKLIGNKQDLKDILFDSIIDKAQEGSREIRNFAKEYGIAMEDVAKFGWQNNTGNIHLMDRAGKAITWDENTIADNKVAIESRGIDPAELMGTHSTILSESQSKGDFEIVFSPLLETDDGLVLLTQADTDAYLDEVFNKAVEHAGGEDKLTLADWLFADSKANEGMGLIANVFNDENKMADAEAYANYLHEISAMTLKENEDGSIMPDAHDYFGFMNIGNEVLGDQENAEAQYNARAEGAQQAYQSADTIWQLHDAFTELGVEQESYEQNLIRLGTEFNSCSDEIEELQKAIRDYGAEDERAEEATRKLSSAINQAKWAKAGDDLHKLYEEQEKFNKATKDGTTDAKNLWGYLTEQNGSEAAADQLKEIKDTLYNLTGLKVDDDWVNEHLPDIIEWTNGSEQGLYSLLDALGDLKFNQILDELPNVTDEMRIEFQGMFDDIQTMIDEHDFSVEPILDNAKFLAAVNEMATETHMSGEQIRAVFRTLGYDVNMDKKSQTYTVEVPKYGGSLGDKVMGSETQTYTVEVPYVSSIVPWGGGASRGSTAPSGKHSPSSKDKGGKKGKKGGGGKDPDRKEDERNRYQKVDATLSKLNDTLDKYKTKEEHLIGKDLIKNLNEQLKIEQEQYRVLEKKRKLQKEEQKELKGKLGKYGIKFDDDGLITNYDKVYKAVLKKWNHMSAKQQEKNKDYYDNFVKWIEQYDSLASDLRKSQNEKLEKAYEEIETKIKKLKTKFTIEFDFVKAKKDWNSFLRSMTRETDYAMQSALLGNSLVNDKQDIKVAYGEMTAMFKQLDKYRNGDASVFTKRVKQKDGTYKVVAKDEIEIQKELAEALSKGQEALTQYRSDLIDIEDTYMSAIDYAIEGLDKEIEAYEYINTLLEKQANLIELAYGKTTNIGIEKLLKNNEQQIAMDATMLNKLRNDANQLLNNMNSAVSEADWQKYAEAYKEKVEEIYERTEDMAEAIRTTFEYNLSLIQNRIEFGITGGFPLERMQKEWELVAGAADRYLDSVNKAYAIQKLANQYEKHINEIDNLYTQQKLTNIMNEQLAILREKDKLSQAEVDYAQSLYDLAVARMALEEAQSAKTQMRLVQTASGSFMYEYVTDEEDIRQREEALAEAENQAYNKAKNGVTDLASQIFGDVQGYIQDIADIAQDDSYATEADRQEAMRKRQEVYSSMIGDGYKTFQSFAEDFLERGGTEEELYKLVGGKSAYDALMRIGTDWDNISEDYLTQSGFLASQFFSSIKEVVASLDSDAYLSVAKQMASYISSITKTLDEIVEVSKNQYISSQAGWQLINDYLKKMQGYEGSYEEFLGKQFDNNTKADISKKPTADSVPLPVIAANSSQNLAPTISSNTTNNSLAGSISGYESLLREITEKWASIDNVNITANFPSATNSGEIQKALTNLINYSQQYAGMLNNHSNSQLTF